jgi:hypothetical protein
LDLFDISRQSNDPFLLPRTASARAPQAASP